MPLTVVAVSLGIDPAPLEGGLRRLLSPTASAEEIAIVPTMSVGAPNDGRRAVAVAAVTCGRLSNAARVTARRGVYRACADEYGVKVTEANPGRPSSKRNAEEENERLLVEHWGADMLESVTATAKRADPMVRARVAARTVRDYGLDSLRVEYPEGGGLAANNTQVILYGPPRGVLRRRDQLLSALISDLV